MIDNLLKSLKKTLLSEPAVRFAYLFGSHARKKAGPLSDIDIAVYLDSECDDYGYRFRLAETLMRTLKKENVDVVILNKSTPLMRHEVMKDGIVVKDDRGMRFIFETQTLRDYLDAEYLRSTCLSDVKQRLMSGTYFG